MFTKEFIKISQILDHHGMHRQADDLLKIAQAAPSLAKLQPIEPQISPPSLATGLQPMKPVVLKPSLQPMTPLQPKGKPATKAPTKAPTKPLKSTAPTARPVTLMTPAEQNQRFDYYSREISSVNDKEKAENLKTQIDLQYNNNYLDYATYKKLIDSLVKVAAPFGLNLTPLNPINPTAFPSNVNETPMMGRTDPMTGKVNSIQLATPLEGLTAAGEKALPNREERDLPALVANWNEYLKTDSFKTSIEERIKELERDGKDTTQLQQLLDKAKTDSDLKVGDFGNNGKASEVYGVEAKPLTSITGTPTTPAAGTATTATPAAGVAPPTQAPNR
jgi:hypothetical protein